VSISVPLLSREQITQLPERAREVIEYRKSGLSLNHIQGCPLDCAYCIRHTYGLWDQRVPRALMRDPEAVEALVAHRYFQPHVTPLQLFNRATDPFLPVVRPHTFAVLEDLDGRGLRNHVLVITRHQMKPSDIDRLNRLSNLKVTLLFTYSGIEDKRIEPYPSSVAADSLLLMSAPRSRRYRTILYWRPLVPGLNDSPKHLDGAYYLAKHADATVYTGLFYRAEIQDYYRSNGLPEPYEDTARRKIVPETLERRVLAAFDGSTPLFRKTSCAVSYVHGLPDYNGHVGIRELCDICPLSQLDLCHSAHRVPTVAQLHEVADSVPEGRGPSGRGHLPTGGRRERPARRATPLLHPTHPGVPGSRCCSSAPCRATWSSTHRVGRRTAMTDWTSFTYVVVDVEGNGQQPPELVELAVVPIAGGIVGEPTSWLVRPPHPIKHIATTFHGLRTIDVADCPAVAEISAEVLHALKADALVAHNAHVDVDVLRRELPGWEPPETFDTLKLARRLVPELPGYKLGDLVERYKLAEGLPDDLKPHRATYDTLVTARLFALLADQADSLEALRGEPPEKVDEDALF
jgi:DNA polymerase III epsilon subunit-like protein/DNA repair photolyase